MSSRWDPCGGNPISPHRAVLCCAVTVLFSDAAEGTPLCRTPGTAARPGSVPAVVSQWHRVLSMVLFSPSVPGLLLCCSRGGVGDCCRQRFLRADSRSAAPSRRNRSPPPGGGDEEKTLQSCARGAEKPDFISPLLLFPTCCNLFFSSFAYRNRSCSRPAGIAQLRGDADGRSRGLPCGAVPLPAPSVGTPPSLSPPSSGSTSVGLGEWWALGTLGPAADIRWALPAPVFSHLCSPFLGLLPHFQAVRCAARLPLNKANAQ